MKTSTRGWLGAAAASFAVALAMVLLGAPAAVDAPAEAEVRSPAPVAAVVAEQAPTPSPAPAVAPSAPSAPSEQELFSHAEQLLVAEPSRAIEVLRAADAQYPRGALADERQFMKLRARVNLDQIAEARVDATDYLELNPRSPLAGRIHQLLGIRPPFEVPH